MWNIIYNCETLSSVSLDRTLIYPLPVNAVVYDVRCDCTGASQLNLEFWGDFAPGDGGGLAAPRVLPNESYSFYPTTSFLKRFTFPFPVSQIHLQATSATGKKLYIAQLAEYYPS